MQTHQLKRTHPNRAKSQVGRGGKRGKTSGRGTKGQKARAGHKMRPEIRDMIKKLPKLRGRGKNSFKSIQIKPTIVTLAALEKAFAAGETVTPDALIAKGVIKKRHGKVPAVKILSAGEVTKKLTISSCTISAGALQKVTAAGGNHE